MNRKHRFQLAVVTVASLSLATLGGLAGCAAESPAEQRPEATATDQSGDERGFFQRILSPEPERFTVPAGTVVTVQFLTPLSSHESQVGERFEAEVVQDVAAGGGVAIPSGSRVIGSVTEAHGPKKVGGRARLSLSFDRLELESGESVPISASFAQSGKSETPKDAAIIGGSTLGGAILGEAIDEGEGTVVGGVVGAIGGVVGAMKTKGKPVTVPAGTRMHLELRTAVSIGGGA